MGKDKIERKLDIFGDLIISGCLGIWLLFTIQMIVHGIIDDMPQIFWTGGIGLIFWVFTMIRTTQELNKKDT